MREVVDMLDGRVVRLWAHRCVHLLAARCEEINALNVFPIPDSDTGTNLLHTMSGAVGALESIDGIEDARQVTAALARGALDNARGNSGVMMSAFLRAWAEVASESRSNEVPLVSALDRATYLVEHVVSVPTAGTLLSVLQAAADACSRRTKESSLAELASCAAEAAAVALDETTAQLPQLRAAGVVDAGGLGLLVILDALVDVSRGHRSDRRHYAGSPSMLGTQRAEYVSGEVGQSVHEVMYRMQASDDGSMDALRVHLGGVGDSVAIGGDGQGNWSVHVHSADVGAVIELGMNSGDVHDIRVSCTSGVRTHGSRGILAVVEGDGTGALFESEGATVLRCDDRIDSDLLLSAILDMPHREVLVLPHGALTAQELVAVSVRARDHDRNVLMLPCSSMVQGLAALAVHDASRVAADDAFAMSDAAAATRWGSLRIADERALTWVGTCEPGDGLGLFGREVVVIEHDAVSAGCRLLDQLLAGGGELVTMLAGRDAPPGLTDRLAAHIARTASAVEVVCIPGGHARDLVQLGVE